MWVSYNGEIYNFRALRRRLEARGHCFRTSSDTEVIVHGWEEWGAGLVEQLRGMFAFALVDQRRRSVLLARDPFGIKPLVYTASPQFLAFASEIAPLASLLRQKGLDSDALRQYLALGYVPAPATIFKEIRKLPPGHKLEIGFDGADCRVSRYWRLGSWQHAPAGLDAVEEECHEVLNESVKAHLVADVPFGAFLSGGVDSSLIVAAMARHVGRVHTFSIGFEDAGYDELPYARMVAERYGTVHHEEYVTGSIARSLPALVRHYGEPFADSSAIPTYYVSRLARDHVSMVLSGDGGDELFGGYNRYRWFRSCLRSRKRPLWKRVSRGALRLALPQRFPRASPLADAKSFDWPAFMPCIHRDVRRLLVHQELAESDGLPIDAFADASACIEDGADPRAAQWMDFHTYLPGDVLTKVDIASMMTGLEVRTPLLDLEVASFAVRLPMKWGIGDGDSDRYAGKKVLRSLLAREMGEEFATRPKAGFTVPMKKWFAVGSELDCFFRDTVLAGDARIGRWLKTQSLRDLHGRHVAGQDQSTPLWAVLVLETWMRQFGV